MIPNRNLFYFQIIMLTLIVGCLGLKCRVTEHISDPMDMEYAVRQCVKQIMDNNDGDNNERSVNFQRNKVNNNQDKLGTILKDRPFREHRIDQAEERSNNRPRPTIFPHPDASDSYFEKGQNNRPNRRRPFNQFDGQDEGEDDFYPINSDRDFPTRKFKNNRSPPHSMMQQLQYEQDMIYNNKDYNNNNYRPFYNNNKNKQSGTRYQSGLGIIEPCLIHCIFKEMQMIDDRGRLIKQIVINKMTQKIRNRELKDFIQDSIEDCSDMVQYESHGYKNNKSYESQCATTKMFALCLEDRGKQVCEDWEDPIKPRPQEHIMQTNNTQSLNKG